MPWDLYQFLQLEVLKSRSLNTFSTKIFEKFSQSNMKAMCTAASLP